MKLLYQRNFKVDYYEKEENCWEIVSHLEDEHHDIKVLVDVAVPEMIIKDMKIKFDRYPMKQCLMIEEKAKELIGADIYKDYSVRCLKTFLGDKGCPNIMILLGAAVPGLVYFYYPYQIKTGKISEAQWWEYVRKNLADACLAHTMMEI